MSKRSLLPLIIAAVLAIALLIVALVLITEQSKRLLPQSPDLSASSEASVSSSASSKPAESSSVPESETDQSEAPSESSSEACAGSVMTRFAAMMPPSRCRGPHVSGSIRYNRWYQQTVSHA